MYNERLSEMRQVLKLQIAGPLFINADTGPGDELFYVKFGEDFYNKGEYIELGLPSSTEATQEMDQGYSEFKPACYKCTKQVAAINMALQMEAEKNMRKKKANSPS